MFTSVCPTPYYSPQYMTAGGKKQPSKDPATNHWQQSSPPSSMHQPHRPHHPTTAHTHPPHLHNSIHHRRTDDDGGWSRGSPAKGSGWNSKHKNHSMTARDTTKAGNQAVDWGGSPEMDSVAVWPVSEHKDLESGGSGEGDGWNTFSPGQSNSSRQHSQSENWMSDEGSLSMGDNVSSPHSNSSPSPSTTGWNVVPDVPNVQQELEPIGDDELDEEIPDSSVDDRALQQYQREDQDGSRKSEERSIETRSSWDNLHSMPPVTKTDKEVLEYTKDSSPSSFSDNTQRRSSSPSSKNTSCSPSGDMEKTIEGGTCGAESGGNTFSADRENSKELTTGNASQSRELSSGGTPDGGGLGMSVWKAHASVGGSTSSINSIGSSSSWKSEGKNGYHNKPNFSPRKSTRYDSQSSTVSSGSGVKVHLRKMKKPSTGLDDALESLHSEPSGWGDLPSPKPTDVDNGTEIWGVAPDDMHRKPKGSNGWGESGGGGLGKMGGGMMGRGSGEWGEDSAGIMPAGWPGVGDSRGRTVSRVGTPGTPGSQWIPPNKDGWSKKNRQHSFQDNVSKLMDMGFSHQMAEKYLKANGNDLKTTISDPLAVSDDSSLERMMGSSNASRTSKKQPGKTLPGVNHLFGQGITTPPGGTPSSHKDLYHQQFVQNSLSTLTQSHPPLPTGGTHMQLLQMQQQYMQMPSATVLGYQQMLTQQLSQLKGAKQQVMQQLRQVGVVSMQGGGSSAQLQLQTRLNLINQFISHINQQLMLQKYPSQTTKDKPVDGMKSVTPGSVGSPHPLGRNTPPSRNKDMKIAGPLTSRSLSLPGGAHEHNLAMGMQGLNVNGHVTPSSISQSSARSVSRLQQIISGSSEENPHVVADDKAKFHFLPQSATVPAEMYSSTSSPLTGGICSTTITTPASTPFSPARSFTDIQEFRPGVPWQPRALPTEPAQLYAKPGTTQHPELRTVQSEPSFSHLIGLPPGVGLGQQRRPPSLGYNPPGMNFQGHVTPSEQQHQGWQSTHGSTSSPMTNSPFSVAGTPDSAFPSMAFGKRSRPQTQIPPPPHSLPFNSSGELGQPLSRPSALFPNANTFSQAPGHPSSLSSSASSDVGGKWGSSHRTYPTSNDSGSNSTHPPTSLSSSSVWDSSAAGSNPSSWSSLSRDKKSNGNIVTPSSASEPAGSHFSSPPNTSSDRMTPGLSRAWEKGGLLSPSHKSPEPTFAEWQAGKKAHLSVFKLPSNPPSSWLCIRNVNTQVDEASLRDVCSEFGILDTVILAPDAETAIVQYASKEQAMQAKSGLDKSPVISGVSVVVDFVSEEKVSSLLLHQQQQQQQQQSQRAGLRGTMQQSSRDDWSNPNPLPPGNSTAHVHNGSHWDNMNLGQFPRPPTSTSDEGSVDKDTTANALWSDSAFLPGLSSPWSSQPQPESALFPSTTSSAGKQEPSGMRSSPSLSTYLPNGLF